MQAASGTAGRDNVGLCPAFSACDVFINDYVMCLWCSWRVLMTSWKRPKQMLEKHVTL